MTKLTEHDAAINALNVNGFDDPFGYNDDLFLLDNWEACNAIGYLVGIQAHGNDSETGNFCLETLSQKIYSEPKDTLVINYFNGCANRIRGIWDSGSHKEHNPPKYYIDWALSKKIDIPWLGYAIQKGFYKLDKTTSKQFVSNSKAENNLYRIIGALKDVLTYYPLGKNGDKVFKSQAQLIKFLEEKCSGVPGVSKSNLEEVFKLANQMKE
jgi:hypothetical protein